MTLSKSWTDTVDDGLTNVAWDAYDALIQAEVGPCPCTATDVGYNPRFIKDVSTGYVCVDWKLIKAMLWVESGGPKNAAWQSRPFQIGNKGDQAYTVLKQGSEGSALIMSEALAKDIKTKSIDLPELNVKAGIAYAFTRMAKFKEGSIIDEDQKIYIATVVKGDSLDRIAHRVGTTVEVLKKFQGSAGTILKIGQEVQYQKAKLGKIISSWRTWDFATVADRYNGGGDLSYAEKLEYVSGLIKKLKR